MAKMSFAEKIKNLFSKKVNEEFFEEIEDALIEGDVGAKTAIEFSDKLKLICKKENLSSEDEIKNALFNILKPYLKSVMFTPEKNKTNVWMVLGVNGVGKTTSVAKIARWYKNLGEENVVLSSSDTFRAAAIEQLELHGKNLGIRVVSHQHGSDASAVVFDAAEAVKAKGGGLVLADTAGRLHNKENLVKELEKIKRTCETKASENCCKKILVLDSTTGQNALRQAEVFHEAVGVDAIVLTKCDSTAKGGIAITIGKELNIPLIFSCYGEGYDDISSFDVDEYLKSFLGM